MPRATERYDSQLIMNAATKYGLKGRSDGSDVLLAAVVFSSADAEKPHTPIPFYPILLVNLVPSRSSTSAPAGSASGRGARAREGEDEGEGRREGGRLRESGRAQAL